MKNHVRYFIVFMLFFASVAQLRRPRLASHCQDRRVGRAGTRCGMDGLPDFGLGLVVRRRADSLRLAAGPLRIEARVWRGNRFLVAADFPDGVRRSVARPGGLLRAFRAVVSGRVRLGAGLSRQWPLRRRLVSHEGTRHGLRHFQCLAVLFPRALRAAHGLDRPCPRLASLFSGRWAGSACSSRLPGSSSSTVPKTIRAFSPGAAIHRTGRRVGDMDLGGNPLPAST